MWTSHGRFFLSAIKLSEVAFLDQSKRNKNDHTPVNAHGWTKVRLSAARFRAERQAGDLTSAISSTASKAV
jgi:hypothetical protein